MTTSDNAEAFENLRIIGQKISDLQVENGQLKQELEFFRREWARMKTPVHERDPQQPQWKSADGKEVTPSQNMCQWLCRNDAGIWFVMNAETRPATACSRLD